MGFNPNVSVQSQTEKSPRGAKPKVPNQRKTAKSFPTPCGADCHSALGQSQNGKMAVKLEYSPYSDWLKGIF